ncbi:MAG: hypothetical protein HC892_22210 [Saprospiraceae bacterium]|nr:hypothetical protein [Saprospiraceae bacterium]
MNSLTHKVQLKNRHLLVAADVAQSAFGEVAQVFMVYYPNQRSLLLAPMDDTIFSTLHKAALQMLKTRNLNGDKSLSLEEILIDHEIDDTDRELPFLQQPGMKLLQVTL